jgi:hypothetical protein
VGLNTTAPVRHPVDRVVVHEHKLTIGGPCNINLRHFDPEAGTQRKSCQGIFGSALSPTRPMRNDENVGRRFILEQSPGARRLVLPDWIGVARAA